jgi:hypothetical protein
MTILHTPLLKSVSSHTSTPDQTGGLGIVPPKLLLLAAITILGAKAPFVLLKRGSQDLKHIIGGSQDGPLSTFTILSYFFPES